LHNPCFMRRIPRMQIEHPNYSAKMTISKFLEYMPT
jgi:hypothetical protein